MKTYHSNQRVLPLPLCQAVRFNVWKLLSVIEDQASGFLNTAERSIRPLSMFLCTFFLNQTYQCYFVPLGWLPIVLIVYLNWPIFIPKMFPYEGILYGRWIRKGEAGSIAHFTCHHLKSCLSNKLILELLHCPVIRNKIIQYNTIIHITYLLVVRQIVTEVLSTCMQP